MYEQRRVKVFFKNGLTCEGKVMGWCTEEGSTDACLQSLNGGDYLHLYNVLENVQMVRIFEETEGAASEQPIRSSQPQKPAEPIPEPRPVITKKVPKRVPVRAPKPVNEPAKKPAVVEPPAPELEQRITDQHLRLQKLAELRDIQKKALREQVSDHLTSAEMTDITKPVYETPNFTKRNS